MNSVKSQDKIKIQILAVFLHINNTLPDVELHQREQWSQEIYPDLNSLLKEIDGKCVSLKNNQHKGSLWNPIQCTVKKRKKE